MYVRVRLEYTVECVAMMVIYLSTKAPISCVKISKPLDGLKAVLSRIWNCEAVVVTRCCFLFSLLFYYVCIIVYLNRIYLNNLPQHQHQSRPTYVTTAPSSRRM